MNLFNLCTVLMLLLVNKSFFFFYVEVAAQFLVHASQVLAQYGKSRQIGYININQFAFSCNSFPRPVNWGRVSAMQVAYLAVACKYSGILVLKSAGLVEISRNCPQPSEGTLCDDHINQFVANECMT